MIANIRWAVIALSALAVATIVSLVLTSGLHDAAAWWQAILSGSALIGSVCFWRMDRDREREIASQERVRIEAERIAKFRSIAILILNPVLEIDTWVRAMIKRNVGPGEKINSGGVMVQVVRTIRPIPEIMAEISNLYHLESDAAPLQRAVFRYLQLEQLLKDAHDETAKVQADAKLSKEEFQDTLKQIHEDLNLFLKALYLALWGDKDAADAFGERRANLVAVDAAVPNKPQKAQA